MLAQVTQTYIIYIYIYINIHRTRGKAIIGMALWTIKMWDTCALGDDCPKTLQLTIWFVIYIHMGMRGRDEHHKYRYGDFALKETTDGKNMLNFVTKEEPKLEPTSCI